MSVKVQAFANIITNPLNIHNFLVKIDDVDLDLIVQSTVFPSESLRTITLYVHGEPVRYPTLPENSGSWSVRVPENDNGIVKQTFEKLKSSMWNQKTGVFTPKKWKNVQIFARDLADNIVFSVILHGVWLKGRNDVNLANDNPANNWNWDYQFVYNWIEDVDYKNDATNSPMK